MSEEQTVAAWADLIQAQTPAVVEARATFVHRFPSKPERDAAFAKIKHAIDTVRETYQTALARGLGDALCAELNRRGYGQ